MRELAIHRNYIMFYRFLEEISALEILRVKHTAQQMP
ncbi:hypothetical protein ABF87_09125 [Nitrosomonas sp. JL21]|nr:hypothetical protein [Nitrosomonas sp. JL21]